MDARGLMSVYSRSFAHLGDDEKFGHRCRPHLIVCACACLWDPTVIVKPTIRYIYDAEMAKWKLLDI